MKYYTGIGSRNTPKTIQFLMKNVSEYLCKNNYILRSGGADGADTAFETGCNNINKNCEIYLPWSGFNKNKSKLIVTNQKAFEIAEKYHPYWHNLKQGAKKLQARNSHQVLGKDLETPSDFLLCYTKNGKGQGGTGQAIRIAKAYNIPIFDFGIYGDKKDDFEINYNKIKRELYIFLQNNMK